MNTSRSPSSSTLKSIPLLLILLLSTSLPTEAYSYTQLNTLMSLSHSLMNRVANLRAQRGDHTGSLRARRIAEKLNGGGLGFWKGISLMGWDYIKNYAWREMSTVEMFPVVSDMKDIWKGMNELTKLKSDKERMAWMVRNYQNIFRLSKSMLRARRIAEKLNGGGLGFWKGISLMEWDYIKNYAWREMSTVEMFRFVSDMKEIWKGMNELTKLKSDKERMAWMVRNYQNIFRLSKPMLQKLLHVFSRSGPVIEVVLILQEEVEGGLLRDCLELGTGDLKGVIQIVKDIALQFSTSREQDEL